MPREIAKEGVVAEREDRTPQRPRKALPKAASYEGEEVQLV